MSSRTGWPDQQGQIDNEVRPYFHHRDELTIIINREQNTVQRRQLRHSHGNEARHIEETPCDTQGCRVNTEPGKTTGLLAWVEGTS